MTFSFLSSQFLKKITYTIVEDTKNTLTSIRKKIAYHLDIYKITKHLHKMQYIHYII